MSPATTAAPQPEAGPQLPLSTSGPTDGAGASARSGLVLGIGCDLVEVARIERALERHGERFLQRTFTEEERAYCASIKHSHKHYAARWAAKEAVAKAFGTGIGAELGWTSIGVYHGPLGEPRVRLDVQARALLHTRGASDVLLTLSHTEAHALAFAVLVAPWPATTSATAAPPGYRPYPLLPQMRPQ